MPLLGALLGEGLLGSPAVDDLDRRVRWHGVVLPNDIAAADAEAFAEATGRRVYCATGAAELAAYLAERGGRATFTRWLERERAHDGRAVHPVDPKAGDTAGDREGEVSDEAM